MDTVTTSLSFTNTIIITLISAGTAALITLISELIKFILSNNAEKRKTFENKKTSFIEGKKEAYIMALNKLLFIKKGFSITEEDMRCNSKLSKEIHEEANDLRNVSSVFRLYASDKVWNLYEMLLNNYKQFAYTNANGPRLFEETKEGFGNCISLLARLMHEDLEYRVYDKEVITIKCPRCGREHDFIKDCKCGLKLIDLPKELINKQKNK